MAIRRSIAATVLVLCLVAGIRAQSLSPAASPGGNDCFTTLANMSDCLTYVQAGSKLTKPEKPCCGELAGLVESNPICLCEFLAKPDFAGIKIDLNRALQLPSVCGVSTPPVSTCSAVGVPVSLPPSSSNVNPPSPSQSAPSPTEAVAAPGPAGMGGECFSVLANMSDCLTFVEEGSKLTQPEKPCCGELAGLVDTNPICLCQMLANPNFAGIKIDLNKALQLPSICGVSTPPVSTCAAVGVPVSLPSSSGAYSSSGTSDLSSPSASPGGSVASPPTGSGATSLVPSCLLFIFGLASIFL
ncbi:hypothetical protein QN277_016964 [Acacia crassicarpa]|uniref:Bifunctional inhibitor/plant lipid transfer protein/seed storage helical domain-containing protein n=1 Tax=Acacia crassicarpa TaxID=499986 RepID=A0AAE1TC63_9FABA|nr:hypothetical protein QN277_016964 [Acacia crassicarpa]